MCAHMCVHLCGQVFVYVCVGLNVAQCDVGRCVSSGSHPRVRRPLVLVFVDTGYPGEGPRGKNSWFLSSRGL